MMKHLKIIAALGISLAFVLNYVDASKAQQNPVTAIDIALEPDATMLQHAQADNARLLKDFPKGFALDATHNPHVTLLQQFVRTADLDKVYAAANAVLAKEKPTQDFVRVYSKRVYGVTPDHLVCPMGCTTLGYDKDGKPFLTKEPKLLLNDDKAGKVEGIHLMIGRRPRAAFGNSNGDKEMLEWTYAGAGARLEMLVLHDDADREYSYGTAMGLPTPKLR